MLVGAVGSTRGRDSSESSAESPAAFPAWMPALDLESDISASYPFQPPPPKLRVCLESSSHAEKSGGPGRSGRSRPPAKAANGRGDEVPGEDAGGLDVCLALYDSQPVPASCDADRGGFACNAGAAIWATAWLPMEGVSGGTDQHIAVGTYVDGATHALTSGPNAIQIWRLPPQRAAAQPSEASPAVWLELLHDGGGVLALSWCPSGNKNERPAPGRNRASTSCSSYDSTALVTTSADNAPRGGLQFDRLGLLAAACADGRVRIFAVPTLESLEAVPASYHLRAAQSAHHSARGPGPMRAWMPPVLELEPNGPVLPLTLDWCAQSTHLLAVGLDDGIVSVWDLHAPAHRAAREGRPGGRTPEPSANEEVADPDAEDLRGVPLGTLSAPSVTLGSSTRMGGELSRFFTRGSTGSSQALGHAGPVRRVRWSPAPHELLASVGHDGLLCVWDPKSAVPMLQRHGVVPYAWALDALWVPSGAAAVFVAADSPALRLQALRDDVVLPADVLGNGSRFRTTAGGPPRPFTFGCAPTATVWALAASGSGEFIAGVTSDGRLELVREVRQRINRRQHRRYLEGQPMAQLQSVPEVDPVPPSPSGSRVEVPVPLATMDQEQDRAPGSKASLHVALGHAAKAFKPGTSLAGPSAALRCVACNSKAAAALDGEWIACGGGAGLLLILPAPTADDGKMEEESSNEDSPVDAS